MRARRLPLDRESLKTAFYAQCYPASVFALALSLGAALIQLPHVDARLEAAALALMLAAFVGYVVVETRWFGERIGLGYLRGFAAGFGGLFLSLAVVVGVALAFNG